MLEGLPDWWIRFVALERLDCRSFFSEDNWIVYDLDVGPAEKRIIADADVLISGPFRVLDGVDPVSLPARMIRGMAGGYFEPFAEDMLGEGRLTDDSFPMPGNSIEQADPITSLSDMVYVRHDDEIYQWEVGERQSGIMAGQQGEFPHRERSFVVSDEFPELFYRAQRKHEAIHHTRNQVSSGELSEEEGRVQMSQLYSELQGLYEGFYSDIYEYSLERKAEFDVSRRPDTPPTLTGIDRAVEVDEEGNVLGKSSVEALTYRRAVHAALEARRFHEKLQEDRQVSYIERELEHSATAIVLAVQSAESYINGLAQEELPAYWENLEQVNIRSKWQTVSHLITGEKVFGPEDDVFGKFKRAVTCRNRLVHFKKDVEEFVERPDYGYVSSVVQYANHEEAYRAVSGVSELINQLADARDESPPNWVNSNMWVYRRDPGGIDSPLNFDYWIEHQDGPMGESGSTSRDP